MAVVAFSAWGGSLCVGLVDVFVASDGTVSEKSSVLAEQVACVIDTPAFVCLDFESRAVVAKNWPVILDGARMKEGVDIVCNGRVDFNMNTAARLPPRGCAW